ncbi:MAG: DUF5678 domain-containing protein [Candidatus Altiarchaeales archaeon]|nr:hypothetical protein [Candidatus Altiarchaeota archaeon]MBU4341749.1 hypothetical protein [Candidatus Altiarchaeota archaeon]MBU4437585.1 hypothetical protein [Candidatus Altiarchaeota archaeon]MCG2782746.1 DUF5678 domain-containing protein [Candidatus Altiarchaeales archaeon]
MDLNIDDHCSGVLAKQMAHKRPIDENQDWFNEHIKELKKEHGGTFVAIRNKYVIESNNDFDKLFEKFKKESSKVYIVYLPKEGEVSYW